MKVDPKIHDWLRWALVSGVPLRRLDAAGNPIEIASACLVVCEGRKFVLSASHAVRLGDTGWALELDYDPAHGTEMYWPKQFFYLADMGDGGQGGEQLDLCFAEIAADLQPMYAHRTPISTTDVRPRHIFSLEDFAEPAPQEIFAFGGEVKPERHGASALVTEMNVYPNLKLVRSEGAYHVFRLPVTHPGHAAFRGCSGAPIVDMHRRVVALVSSGDTEANTVRGIAISRAMTALKWYCMTHPPA